MKSPTRAHTVPRFYLRGFIAPESDHTTHAEPYVWLGSIATGEVRRRSPKNISIETGYYDAQVALMHLMPRSNVILPRLRATRR